MRAQRADRCGAGAPVRYCPAPVGSEKRERQKAGRQARLEQARAVQARRMRWKLIRNLAIVAVVVIALLFVLSRGEDDDTDDVSTASTPTTDVTGSTGSTEPEAFAFGTGEGHAQQRHRLALAGGDEHVHLAAGAHLRDLGGEAQELVGLLAHGGHDDDDVVTVTTGAGDVVDDLPHALGIGDRRAAELLNDESHGPKGYRHDRGKG